MQPTENSAQYNIEFYPESTRMIQQFEENEELKYLCNALKYDTEYNHTIFLVNDGHCYAACDVRRIDEGVVTAVVEYAYTMEESRHKGHYSNCYHF